MIGEYLVFVEISDDKNYTLGDTKSVTFIIKPILLFVVTEDLREYWFGDRDELCGTVVDGKIIDGDLVNISFYEEEGIIKASCDNENYRLSVAEGRLIEVNGFAPHLKKALLFSFILAITLFVLTVAFVYKKDAFIDYLASRRAIRQGIIGGQDASIVNSTLTPSVYDVVECGSHIMSVDVERAEELITNSLAKTLIHRSDEVIETAGNKRVIINIDTLNDNFNAGDRVDINELKKKRLIINDAGFVKVLARGSIDKPLKVYLNEYSLAAIKMIALTGGEAYRVQNIRKKQNRNI